MKKFVITMGIAMGIVISMLVYNKIEAKESLVIASQSDLGTGDYLTVVNTVNGFGKVLDSNVLYVGDYLIG